MYYVATITQYETNLPYVKSAKFCLVKFGILEWSILAVSVHQAGLAHHCIFADQPDVRTRFLFFLVCCFFLFIQIFNNVFGDPLRNLSYQLAQVLRVQVTSKKRFFYLF